MDINTEINRIMNMAIDARQVRMEKADEVATHNATHEGRHPCAQCNGNGSKYVRGEWNAELDMHEAGEDESCFSCSGKGFIEP